MSYDSGIIGAPVSIGDVKKCLGETSNDLRTLCQSGKINPFARYKPLAVDTLLPLTDEQRKEANHGISIPDKISGGTTLSADSIEDAAGNKWYYLENGLESCPARLLDFNGYDHYAVPPLQVVYPSEGWEMNISDAKQKTLVVNINGDPADSTTNLQATDFTAELDLRKTYAVAAIDGNKTYIGKNPILDEDSGEFYGSQLSIDVSTLSAATHTICMCLAYKEDDKWQYIPFPRTAESSYNPSSMTLVVKSDAVSGGGGVEDAASGVAFAPDFESEYKEAQYCINEYGGTSAMSNTTKDLLVRLSLTNTSGEDRTFSASDFSAAQYFDGVNTVTRYSSLISTNKPNGLTSENSIIIANNSTVNVYLYFENLFSTVNETSVNTTVEVAVFRQGTVLFDGELNYHVGSDGWTEM
jgi:hypothetical protein